uniref:Cytochrome c biogenesis protein Ccs1 n=1 Tax=Chondria tumulosa TaxID=2740715 RepID=A0A896SR26_9FLOR|nr:Cytochrome c biogenesis protein [Chondria tumulosa]QSD57037.1 Cytochrome c biogenesis protein [Chondria tumulosa]
MKSFQFKNYFWGFLRYLANLNLSICILLFIAFFSILGSLIEQDQNLLYYQINYPVSNCGAFIIDWKFIIFLGLDHIFQTWWFILTLIIFITTLLSCTFFTQLPSLKNARRWKFIHRRIDISNKFSFKESYLNQDNSLIVMIYSLLDSNFFIFYQKDSIYAYKGLYGRISPIFVHFSIVTVLLGSIFSFLSGFTAQEIVPSGEIFHIRHVTCSGILNIIPSHFFGRVKNFYLEYNSDGSIKQFFSELSLLSYRNSYILSKIISVNSPLKYKNFTVYQTDWQLNALKISLDCYGTLQKKLVKTAINGRSCWLSNLPLNSNKQIFLIVFNTNSPIVVFDSDGVVLGTVLVNQNFYVNNVSFIINDIMVSTGLQIKIDIGITLVYTGFFVLMLSTILSYLSYSQIWFYKDISLFQFLASTNRAILFFEEDIFSVNFLYYFYLFFKSLNTIYLNKLILK